MEQGLGVTSKIWDYRHTHLLTNERDGHDVVLPATPLSSYGNQQFCDDFGVKLPYVAGAMANGIASAELVIAMAKENLLGVFGAAGLPIHQISAAIDRIKREVGDATFGVNLIHCPSEPIWEHQLVEVLIHKDIHVVEASAFMGLTEALVIYRCKGLVRSSTGSSLAANKIIAKVSRVEVAEKFMSPPPQKILDKLQAEGKLTRQEVDAAVDLPMADYVTIEADSGGHTDNRPALTLFPAMLALANRLRDQFDYPQPIRLGLAGGIATPSAVASAFAMGASYILTGSINQACVESGTSSSVREILSTVEQADVVMAPAADMFEMGVEVQVIKKGTMFPMRAKKLYEVYKKYKGIDDIPPAERQNLEKQIFRMSLDEVWEHTKAFFRDRDPEKITRCESRPKQKMALIFRWYLGLSSKWANDGQQDRQLDFQIWCGPSMGAFNAWAKGSELEKPASRKVATLAYNLMLVGFMMHRLNIIRAQGYPTEQLENELNRPLTESQIASIVQDW